MQMSLKVTHVRLWWGNLKFRYFVLFWPTNEFEITRNVVKIPFLGFPRHKRTCVTLWVICILGANVWNYWNKDFLFIFSNFKHHLKRPFLYKTKMCFYVLLPEELKILQNLKNFEKNDFWQYLKLLRPQMSTKSKMILFWSFVTVTWQKTCQIFMNR